MGQKNHEIVPSSLIDSIAGLKHGGTFKCLKHLLRHKLVHHDNSKYDGYRLTYLGYDYLAIKALVNRGAIAGVGRQIGVGKESDIFEVTNEEGEVMALKLHRLGRTSFRAVKSKRDYLRKGSHFSWLYLSRLAALKEYAFMKALGDHGLPVPKAIDHNRHAVLMTLLDAYPLVQVRQLSNPRRLYVQLMEMLARLAGLGLVHCDYNEFNLLVNEEEEITLIDFPQMVSVSHPNAQELFERDVECIIRFFSKKLGYVPEQDEELELIRPSFQEAVAAIQGSIDTELRASGFKREHQDALDRFITSKHEDSDEEDDGSSSGEESDDEGEEGSSSSASGSSAAGSSSGYDTDAEGGGSSAVEGASSEPSSTVGGDALAGEGLADAPGSGTGDASDDGGEAALAQADPGSTGEALAQLTLQDQQRRAAVTAKLTEQQRKAARRAAMASLSRNATKSKNKGKRPGTDASVGGGGW
ncbi:Serine threonine- kinase rio2 [Chlorella sorokiniana]|uniref:non-specific serine/threonine protein kinase n=1 Tax=Chlorella sorokiniana TaxID=3076 RepID=A0A2P6TDP1_CHLSO|nr:Serine threonine- kinase rio2 [Chlorella sorokiniana]|eukprot:PRW20749.1 Serine threonine- kinase rio2 [Chlorella sorokiniana]